MATRSPQGVTQLLERWSRGDESALEELMPLVHDELHRLAHQHMRREGPGHILQTSALINEAYLRLVDQPEIRWENRNHFFGIAARLMRRILVDDARKRNSAKRGGSFDLRRHNHHRKDDECASVHGSLRTRWKNDTKPLCGSLKVKYF